MENTPKYEYEEKNSIAIFPGPTKIPLPIPDLPIQVHLLSKIFISKLTVNYYTQLENSVQGVLAASSASYLEELSSLESTWDGENRVVSKFAEKLKQLNNGVKVPPHGWQCSKCDKTENLWLNLSDGTLLCGRKFFDGTGGNNHALEHYQATGMNLLFNQTISNKNLY